MATTTPKKQTGDEPESYTGTSGVLQYFDLRDGETLRRDLRLLLQSLGGALPRLWLN